MVTWIFTPFWWNLHLNQRTFPLETDQITATVKWLQGRYVEINLKQELKISAQTADKFEAHSKISGQN